MKKEFEAAKVILCEDGDTLTIQRNAQTWEAARVLRDYICTLPLTAEQNAELIRVVVDLVAEAEGGALEGGIEWALQESEGQKDTYEPKHSKYLQ